MCGVVAYVGDNFAEIVVVDGLKRLEYRGYDSAGLAVQPRNLGRGSVWPRYWVKLRARRGTREPATRGVLPVR